MTLHGLLVFLQTGIESGRHPVLKRTCDLPGCALDEQLASQGERGETGKHEIAMNGSLCNWNE